MAKRIAQFYKVSFEQFKEGYQDAFGEAKEQDIRRIYDEIKLSASGRMLCEKDEEMERDPGSCFSQVSNRIKKIRKIQK